MTNKYYIILQAGTRVNGMPKFGSNAERLHHEQHINELKAELYPRDIEYIDSLGFISVDLTDEEFIKYKHDTRIFNIEPHTEVTTRATKFITRETATHNQWHLKQLSNRLFNDTAVLCGFKLLLLYTRYGQAGAYDYVFHDIVLISAQNKFIYKNKPYNFEVNLRFKATNDNNTEFEYSPVAHVAALNLNTLPLDVDIYLGYDIGIDTLVLKENIIDNFVPIYTVKIGLYRSPPIIQYSGSVDGVLGFYDLKFVPNASDVYQAIVEGSGVDIIIGDTQLDPTLPDFGGRARIEYNAYSDIYEAEYGSWDAVSPVIDQHGTACALAAGGNISGVANKVNLVGITCLDITEDRGNQSNRLLQGFGYIIDYIQTKKAEAYPKPYPVVVSLSLGSSSVVTAYDLAVASMLNEGAIVCIAAGNDNTTNNNSPYHADAIFIGASNYDITPCSFTNYGPRISVYAPGSDIYSEQVGAYSRWQGTSVACPNVAGLCALFLSIYPEATPAEVKAAIMNVAADCITYNKDDTTYKFVQNPCYGYIDRQDINTAALKEDLIYTVIPYIVGFDGEKIYGNLYELTLNSITSAVVSAGKKESIELATAIRLVP
jgi:hypothetical protein